MRFDVPKAPAAHLDADKLANGAQAAGGDVDVHAKAAAHVCNGRTTIVLQVVELCWREDATKEVPAGEASLVDQTRVLIGPVRPPPWRR